MDEKLIRELIDAANDMLGSEPDMPSHEATYNRLERAVDAANKALRVNAEGVRSDG